MRLSPPLLLGLLQLFAVDFLSNGYTCRQRKFRNYINIEGRYPVYVKLSFYWFQLLESISAPKFLRSLDFQLFRDMLEHRSPHRCMPRLLIAGSGLHVWQLEHLWAVFLASMQGDGSGQCSILSAVPHCLNNFTNETEEVYRVIFFSANWENALKLSPMVVAHQCGVEICSQEESWMVKFHLKRESGWGRQQYLLWISFCILSWSSSTHQASNTLKFLSKISV